MSDLPESFIAAKEEKLKKEKLKKDVSEFLVNNFVPTYTNKIEQYEKWFKGYLKNYIVDNNIDHEAREFGDKLLHICDYLNSAQAKARFDRMTWDVAESKVAEWDKWLQKRISDGDDPENTIFVCELNKGFKVVELNSPKCLSYEGAVMGHCVGSYWNKVASGNIKIFSLRDKNDNPHTTIEYDLNRGEVIQVQGKENKRPISKYLSLFTEFTKKEKLTISQGVASQLDLKQIGWTYVNGSTPEAYKREVLSYLRENPRNQDGGLLDLTGIKEVTEVAGVWDKVITENNIDVTKESEIQILVSQNNISIGEKAYIKKIDLKNGDIKFSDNCVINEIEISNSPITSIPDIKLRSLTSTDCKLLEHIDGAPTQLIIKNSPLLNKIPESKYVNLALDNIGINNANNFESISISLSNMPIKELDVTKFNSVSMDNLEVEVINTVNSETFNSLRVLNCDKLTEVKPMVTPRAKIEIRGCKNLNRLDDIKAHTLDLNTSYVEDLSKINVHCLDIRHPRTQVNLGRRIRVKEIKTNSKSRKQLRSRNLDERSRDRSRRR